MTSLRPLPLDELVATLASEHVKMKNGLDEAREKTLSGDYAAAKEALADVDRIFRQHIADEEGQVLRLLLEVYGKDGANDAIVVFRQHRPIYRLMEEVRRFSLLSSEELAGHQEALKRLLDEHTYSEELRIFPQALAAQSGRQKKTSWRATQE